MGCSSSTGNGDATNKMDFDKVKQGLADNAFTLIDVRNRDEVQAGKIPGAKNLPCK